MRRRGAPLALTAAGSVAAALFANAYASCLVSLSGEPTRNLQRALEALPDFASSNLPFTTKPAALVAALLAACGIWALWAYSLTHRPGERAGEEHGSARWGTRREGRRFADTKHPERNIILTENFALALSREDRDRRYERNRNVLVVGGSGSGKTRGYVEPNIMQMNSDYLVTDPKGETLPRMGRMLEAHGYEVLSFNTVDFSRSMHYSPLAYVNDEADILEFVTCLIENTTGDREHTGDPFWENAERLLYVALIGYLVRYCPPEDRSLSGLVTLLSLAKAKETDEDYMSPLDLLFREVETGMRYMRTSTAREGSFEAGSRISYRAASSEFSWVRTGEPVSYDEMHLDRLGSDGSRRAVFAVMSDTSSLYSFLFAIMMWQTMNVLCKKALADHGGSLPVPVHLVFDEFANIGRLPDVEKMVAVIRSRNISMSVVLQSVSQLKARYKDDAATIVDCCDTTLFLGGKSTDTVKEISESVGKETVDTLTWNESRGATPGSTRNWNTLERDLVQGSEVARLPRDTALVLIAGAMPLKDRKYDITRHPMWPEAYPGHPGARFAEPFDFKAYLEARRDAARQVS
ncbi:VirD4-like conjugal transfer protein, CD1115 family [Curtanaerobium respiraculi]|uniref:VirD4-like conjugal transfer protein, CD1115 family n=1 Tax=Curtanaerobium respiraculi TaxID=2949669 RepID=UPI0024B37B34|nr:type IV secretory system conjugative DNA transfer family protein [Curtanaerobium respiraculi]